MKSHFQLKLNNENLILFIFLLLNCASVFAQRLPDYSPIVERILPSVVSIRTITNDLADAELRSGSCECEDLQVLNQNTTNEVVQELMYASRGNGGSGFILSQDGYIVTNAHVLTGASRIIVSLHDGRQFNAELVGQDELSDLALLKIMAEGLKPARLASSNIELRAGQVVLGIGSPFSFSQSVTAGIISFVERALPENNKENNFVTFIQTDMLINPGNSGGPIINVDGEVIGVSSHIFSTTGASIGISFAVPVGVINYVIPQLLDGQVNRGWVGISTENIEQNLLQDLGLIGPVGAKINYIYPDSPAEKSGLRVNDVIVTIDGHIIKNSEEFIFHVGLLSPDSLTELTVIRNGRYYATELVSEQILH